MLVEAAQDYALLGDPAALTPESLRPHVEGFVVHRLRPDDAPHLKGLGPEAN